MSSNKYEEKVIFRARELAHVGYPKGYKLSEWGKIMEMARLSVAREAEMFKIGFLIDRLEDFDKPQIDILLHSLGLIPPPNETT